MEKSVCYPIFPHYNSQAFVAQLLTDFPGINTSPCGKLIATPEDLKKLHEKRTLTEILTNTDVQVPEGVRLHVFTSEYVLKSEGSVKVAAVYVQVVRDNPNKPRITCTYELIDYRTATSKWIQKNDDLQCRRNSIRL